MPAKKSSRKMKQAEKSKTMALWGEHMRKRLAASNKPDYLLENLKKGTPLELRQVAAKRLESLEIKDPAVLSKVNKALLNTLRLDPSAEVKWRAVRVLARKGGPETLPVLKKSAEILHSDLFPKGRLHNLSKKEAADKLLLLTAVQNAVKDIKKRLNLS